MFGLPREKKWKMAQNEMLQNSSISTLFSEVQNITNLLDSAYKSKLTTKIELGKKAILFKKWLKSSEATNLFEENMLEKWSIIIKVQFSFSEKVTKMCAIVLMVLKFT